MYAKRRLIRHTDASENTGLLPLSGARNNTADASQETVLHRMCITVIAESSVAAIRPSDISASCACPSPADNLPSGGTLRVIPTHAFHLHAPGTLTRI